MFTKEDIKKAAEKELRDEIFRKLVDDYKFKTKSLKWWHRIFPWKILIINRGEQ